MPPRPNVLLASVISARGAYSMVWYDMAALFPALRASSGYSVSALGVFTTAFFLGAGVFQIPAGFVSARLGASRTTLFGLGSITLFTYLSALSAGYTYQVLMRFLTGFGASFFFAPAMVVASSAIEGRRSGLVIGVYNAAFNVGGGVALFALSPISADFGWRVPYLIVASLLLANLFFCGYTFRRIPSYGRQPLEGVSRVFTSRRLLLMIAGILGMAASSYVASQFMVEYTEARLGFSAINAGSISSMLLFGGILGGPLGGWLSDNSSDRVSLTLASCSLVSFFVALLYVPEFVSLFGVSFAIGVFTGIAYTGAYVLPILLREVEPRFAPLAVGMINSAGILAGSLASVGFAAEAVSAGYRDSWVTLGIATILFPVILWRKRSLFEKGAG